MKETIDSFRDRALGTLILKTKKITMKVKVEYEENVPDQEVEYVFDDMFITHERGFINHFFDNKSYVELNGQERIIIRAWKGCNAFDSFEKESKA